jgi:hypothetical protein
VLESQQCDFLLETQASDCNEIIQIKMIINKACIVAETKTIDREKSCRHLWYFNFVIIFFSFNAIYSQVIRLMNSKGHLCLALEVAIH